MMSTAPSRKAKECQPIVSNARRSRNLLQVIEKLGRGEWIRTTDLLVPNRTAQSNSLITEELLSY